MVMTGTGDDSCNAHPLATGYLWSQRPEATMPSPIQFQEHEFELTEVTFRCQQARLLFPGDEFNRRFNGGFPVRGTVHWTDASFGLSARPSTRAKAASASTSPSPAR